jgi:riboflavin-specific deaminase-like protein
VNRPHVLLSVASSLDGYIDDATPDRLLLSNDADFDRVDQVRAGADAILVGANTIRADNPRLMVRSEDRRGERVAQGRQATPVKVTITHSGNLDPHAAFFTSGDVEKIVYTTTVAEADVSNRLGDAATVVGLADRVEPAALLTDLKARGIERLMVEGGGTIHTMFLTAGLVDELHLVFAPFFVGNRDAPRFRGARSLPTEPRSPHGTGRDSPDRRLRALAIPAPIMNTTADRELLERAIALADRSPRSNTAFAVGALIADGDGNVLAEGWSRRHDPHEHAEEAALAAVPEPQRDLLTSATIYTSLEPCSTRASRPVTCTQLILDAEIPRVVFAWREPLLFADCIGAETLIAAGRSVIQIGDLAEAARRPNRHLLVD